MADEEFNKAPFLRALGANVARLRKSKGYSQDRLALEAGFSRGTLSKIEKGMVDPQATTLARIAATIGVPLPKIMEIKRAKN